MIGLVPIASSSPRRLRSCESMRSSSSGSSDDQWIAQIVPAHGGDAAVLTQSLLRLRDLAPDLVLSSASVGEHAVVEIEHDQWFRAVEETAGRPPIESV